MEPDLVARRIQPPDEPRAFPAEGPIPEWPTGYVAYEVCGIPVVQDSAVIPGYFVVNDGARERLKSCVGAEGVDRSLREDTCSVGTFEVEGTPVKFSASVLEGRIVVHPDTWRPLAGRTFGGK